MIWWEWLAIVATAVIILPLLALATLGSQGRGVQPKGDAGPMPTPNGRPIVIRPKDKP